MLSLPMPGLPREFATDDPLGRFYTPLHIARAVVGTLDLQPRRVVEPSVGGGAFARAVRERWPAAHLHGVDIDPGAEGLALCHESEVDDWLSASSNFRADLVVGNPDFDHALDHVRASLPVAPIVAFILPLAYQGVGEWQPLFARHRPAWIRPLIERPWNKSMREVCLYVWDRAWTESWSRSAPLDTVVVAS